MTIDCQEYELLISELLDLELSKTGSVELFLHLSTCENCRTFFLSNVRLHNSLVFSAANSRREARDRGFQPSWSKQGVPAKSHRGPIAHVFRRRYSISIAASALLLIAIIAGTATISTSFVSPARVVEKKVRETVYVVQLPQVEINGYYSNGVKSN
jgi:predicted anti-sigma-YlaC factor YlaD